MPKDLCEITSVMLGININQLSGECGLSFLKN